MRVSVDEEPAYCVAERAESMAALIEQPPAYVNGCNGHGPTRNGTCPTRDTLPEEFWRARPVFDHVRRAAHARLRSADLVLHAVLARVAAYCPHTLLLPPIQGAPGSLNYFVAGVGSSGAGKSSGVALAAELVAPPAGVDVADNAPLGSGEGLAELFMGNVEDPNNPGKQLRAQVRHNAFVIADEGQALTAIMARNGSTTAEALRRAWTGAELGQANASVDRRRMIPAHGYRLAVVCLFQPGAAGRLLADAELGTPQRFVWASAHDAAIPDVAPPWPGPLELPELSAAHLDAYRTMHRGYVRHEFGVAPGIVAEIQSRARAAARGEAVDVDPLDSHAPLHRLKVAALLSLLDGRLHIDPDDWALAALLWWTSRRARAAVVEEVRAGAEAREAAHLERTVQRSAAAEVGRLGADGKVRAVAARLARWLHDSTTEGAYDAAGCARRDLKNRLRSTERALLDAAIERAVEERWITETEGGRWVPGTSQPA